MPEIVGIRFHQAGRAYYFDASDIPLEVNDDVVVETNRGHELAKVAISPKQVLSSEITEPLKPVIRKAQAEDIEKAQKQQKKSNERHSKMPRVGRKTQPTNETDLSPV
jgi:cell fate regulator YaaT (PSP1 superfamily)